MPLVFKHKPGLAWRAHFSITLLLGAMGLKYKLLLELVESTARNKEWCWSLGQRLKGLCSAWASQQKGLRHPWLKLAFFSP